MQSGRLGRSGPLVSRLGLGLAALGRPGYINLGHAEDLERRLGMAEMQARAHEVLDAAWAHGFRYFDVARSYGRAEEFLGSWLRSREISRDQVTIGSKWGYVYTADWRVDAEVHEVKDHSLDTLQRQSRETRERLGDHLDVYQIHSATPETGVLDNDAVLDELARLRDQGTRVGLSVSGTTQAETIRAALKIRRGGQALFSSVQATWNLLERSAGDALAQAHAAGVGVIVKEALANGRLTRRNRDPALAARLAPLLRLPDRLGAGIEEVALGAALSQPWADVVLSGAVTPDQLAANARATALVGEGWSAFLTSIAPMEPEEYWATRSSLPWN